MPHINWSNFGGTFNYMNYGGAITGFSTDANELLLLLDEETTKTKWCGFNMRVSSAAAGSLFNGGIVMDG